ncbi:MAG TPA: tetratricopeptide repeat protein, partial [Thermoanaerobaculia bacterium]|nr:tetratricopeptide repeat protein [Thermoanaerobaculia bacterium]
RMLASYRALHRLHPDHYWATNNLANWLWRLEGAEAALPYVLARARLRPNGFGPTLTAAQALILVRGRPQEAQPYVERLVDLAAVVELPYYRTDEAAWARLWGAHRHWLRGDLEAARSGLDRWAGELEALPPRHGYWVRQLLVRGYRTLGLAARAMELAPLPEFRLTRPYFRGFDAYLGGDPDAVLAELVGEAWEENDWSGGIWRDPVRVAALARSGRVGDARAVVETFRERPSPAPSAVITPPMMEARLRGEIELAEGRPGEAARLLEREAFGSWNDYRLLETAWIEWYGSSYFLAAQALAIAYRRLGRDEDALSVLERAVAERARSYPNGTELWLDTQLRLARLHRELGNAAEAERLENELRDLMRQADPDFWLVRALERTAPR